MKRAIIFVFSLIFCLSFALSASAQTLVLSMAEQVALKSYENNKYIEARQKAEAILEENPESFIGLYILSGVFWQGEGNLQRALALSKDSVRAFEKQYGSPITSPELQNWHKRLLGDQSELYQELDEREQQLRVYEKLESLYDMQFGAYKIWPLMKLQRFEEAYELANKYKNSPEKYLRLKALNSLLALGDAEYKYIGMFQTGEESIKNAADDSCVILNNHARAASIVLKFDYALELANRALKARDMDCPSSPYETLLLLYLTRGDYQQAISAAKKVREEKVERRMKVQKEKETRSVLSSLFLAMGYAEKAESLMRTVILAPDRQGYSSFSSDKVQLYNLVEYYVTTTNYIHRMEETISAWGGYSIEMSEDWCRDKLIELRTQITKLQFSLWKHHQEAIRHAMNPDSLRGLAIPNYSLPPFVAYGMVEAYGSEAQLELIEFEKKHITFEESKLYAPSFAFYRAYAYWKRGDYEEALESIQNSIDSLPQWLNLCILELKAIKADILKESSPEVANRLYLDVMDQFPSVIRMFDLKLPARFETERFDGSDWIIERLKDSPRFKESENPAFVINVYAGTIPSICLSSTVGRRIACSNVDPKLYEAEPTRKGKYALVIDQFHHDAFSPAINATQADINSLDGHAVRINSDAALKDLLDGQL